MVLQKLGLAVAAVCLVVAHVLLPLQPCFSSVRAIVDVALNNGDVLALAKELNVFYSLLTLQSDIAVHNASQTLHMYNRSALLSQHAAILEEYNRFRDIRDIPSFGDLDSEQRFLENGRPSGFLCMVQKVVFLPSFLPPWLPSKHLDCRLSPS